MAVTHHNCPCLMQQIGWPQTIYERYQPSARVIRHGVALVSERCAKADPPFNPWPLGREMGRRPFQRIVAGAEAPQFSHAMGKVVPSILDIGRQLDG